MASFCAAFPVSCFCFLPSKAQIFSCCPTLGNLQPVSSQVKTGEIVFPYILLLVFICCKRENKIMDRMVAGIQFKSALKFFLHVILIYLCPVHILEFCHIFKGLISSLYVVIWSSIMLTRHEHIISFWHLFLDQLSY